MKNSPATFRSNAKRFLHQSLRKAFSVFPQSLRFAVYRSFVDCDPKPDKRLVLKIAETREELQACFRLLHDAYVGSGFMRPDPSGMRITIYHALPTTTTLCAKFDGEVVGTISLIRESVFGFPLQSIFDLHEIREKRGRIAEVSALAVHPKFRNTGGSILFPLMKFMYDYSTSYFDTRHLVIAVNPNRIEMYESLLLFERLTENTVKNYDFANGAPAVGATVDLHVIPTILKRVYGNKPRRKNLYLYFLRTRLRNIVMPSRRYFTTNDPVMTPDLLDFFFNQCTSTFHDLPDRERGLLHSITTCLSISRCCRPCFQNQVLSDGTACTNAIHSSVRAVFRSLIQIHPVTTPCRWSSFRMTVFWPNPKPSCLPIFGVRSAFGWGVRRSQPSKPWWCGASRGFTVSSWRSPTSRGENWSAC